MQVLKEEIRLNILSSAKELFYEKGYNKASIRDIARRSGITVGNVYRYFQNKESVLEGIVLPVYTKIMDFISFSEQLIKEGEDKSFEDFRNIINKSIMQIARDFRFELLILFRGVAETRFEKTREELIALIENRIYKGLFRRAPLENDEAAFLAKVIARSFLDGLIMIIAEMDNSDRLEKMIYRLNDFYYNHVNKRFEDKREL